MGVNNSKLFTKLISGTTFTITGDYGLRSASFVLISGAGTYTGGLTIGGFPSDSLPLVEGNPVTVAVEGNQIIDDLVIDGSGGVIHLIAKH
jgi:hypothetical protein